eukprot:6196415-Pleurochrysis_carterae.AAC.2
MQNFMFFHHGMSAQMRRRLGEQWPRVQRLRHLPQSGRGKAQRCSGESVAACDRTRRSRIGFGDSRNGEQAPKFRGGKSECDLSLRGCWAWSSEQTSACPNACFLEEFGHAQQKPRRGCKSTRKPMGIGAAVWDVSASLVLTPTRESPLPDPPPSRHVLGFQLKRGCCRSIKQVT